MNVTISSWLPSVGLADAQLVLGEFAFQFDALSMFLLSPIVECCAKFPLHLHLLLRSSSPQAVRKRNYTHLGGHSVR